MARVSRANLLIGCITGGALLLRLPGFTESLWFDEIWSTRVILGSVASTVRMLSADLHPPVFNLLMFVWIRIFGDSEIAVRLLPLICGLATVVLTARLAIDYGWRSAAPVAALLMAISPAHIWYSQESRAYSFLMLLVVASVVVFHRIRETHATRWYVAYAALAAAMVFTQYFAAVYVAAIMLLALPDPRARARLWSIGVTIALAVVVYLAVKWRWGLVPTGAGYLSRFTVAQLWRLPFEWLLVGGVLGAPAERPMAIRIGVLAVQVAALLLAGRGLIKSRPAGELAVLLLSLPLMLLAIGLVGQRRFYIERSALTILPFFAVAIAVGATSLARAAWRASAVALIAAFGAVILFSYYAKRDQWTVYKPKADWRGAAARMADEQSRLGRPVVVVAMGPALELRYYNAGFGAESLDPPAPSPHTSAFRERLKRLFAVPVDPHRGTTGKVYEIYEPDVTLVHRVFAREQTGEIILVRNAMTVDWSTNLIALLRADPRLRVEPLSETKGIRLFTVRQDASAAVH
jgi:mannosyltransferase